MNKQRQELCDVEAADEVVENQEQNDLYQQPKQTCPQCHKTMEPNWNSCPYCGYNSKDEEEKKQENENLRFAPPGYRKES